MCGGFVILQSMIKAHIFRVFTDSVGNFGDRASIVIDEGRHIPDSERQTIAQKLNTGETIFINNIAFADISVMHPQGEISFAGVGVLAAAWFLASLNGSPVEHIKGRDGIIQSWQEGAITWVRSSINAMPSWNFKQVNSSQAVGEILPEAMSHIEHTMVWSWIDETKGIIRARTFAPDWEIPEAEGNGSGAMVLASKLSKRLKIIHGKGSEIIAHPIEHEYALGGKVVQDKTLIL